MYLMVRLKDGAGNQAPIMSKRLLLDNQGPSAQAYGTILEDTGKVRVELLHVYDNYTDAENIYVLEEDGSRRPAYGYYRDIEPGTQTVITLVDELGNTGEAVYAGRTVEKFQAPVVEALSVDSQVAAAASQTQDYEEMISRMEALEGAKLPEFKYSDAVSYTHLDVYKRQLVSALQKNSEPVQKITIVPRTMGALGYVMHVPEEEKYLNTEAELRDMLVGLVAGRAAEEVVFDTVTTGAANDIEPVSYTHLVFSQGI